MASLCELSTAGLIRVSGADAQAFLHAQLTSDVAGLAKPGSQYGGYCTPKGRLIATFLVWNLDDAVMLQLPASIAEDVRTRLSRYVLRSKAAVSNATSEYALFGIFGVRAAEALQRLVPDVPAELHAVVQHKTATAARLGGERYVVLVPREHAAPVRQALSTLAQEEPETEWARLEIQHGIPVITPATQEEFVPQMVNLDLIGGVSYSKGCYPGQEIVARTHYLGRSKQRMHRVQLGGSHDLASGDRLYSPAFGAEQASGALVNVVKAGRGCEALAVIQTAAAESADIRWRTPDGPRLTLQTLPYTVPG